jgi:hypothetical protein
MIEKPADNVRGFLLYNPFDKKHFFRIYDDTDTTRRTFTDYKLCAEDIEVTIHTSGLSLYENRPHKSGWDNCLDWSSKTLGRHNNGTA